MQTVFYSRLLNWLLLILPGMLVAQEKGFQYDVVPPYPMCVGYSQTTNLIFPYAILSVDRGSASIMVQKAKGVENILQVKASQKDFEPTNLSIVTSDGRFYSFMVYYDTEPSELNIRIDGTGNGLLPSGAVNQQELEKQSQQVRGMRTFLRRTKNGQQLRLRLAGIWQSQNTMWFRFRVSNLSQVDFKAGTQRFFVRERKRMKRSAIHETEHRAVFVDGPETVPGGGESEWIIGFRPFTISPDKKLLIHFVERDDGRLLVLPLKSRVLLRAKRLPG